MTHDDEARCPSDPRANFLNDLTIGNPSAMFCAVTGLTQRLAAAARQAMALNRPEIFARLYTEIVKPIGHACAQLDTIQAQHEAAENN